MLESFITNTFNYTKLTEEEKQKRGILGRLVGVIADFKNPTRNGRKYSEKLWDKIFDDPIMKEKIQSRCVFGELGHPADRTDIDIEKVAICLAEQPKKGKDGKLWGVFDILDTPNGRLLKSLCDYGCQIGVSSRGSGDTYTDVDGCETVDADTYECECWDAVLLPAVKAARQKYVTESLNKSDDNAKLRKALNEELSKASEEDRRIMEETLKKLEIDYTTSSLEGVSIDESLTNNATADNDGGLMVGDLKRLLKENRDLNKIVEDLREQLSVCYTKETDLKDALNECESQKQALSESVSNLEEVKQQLNREIGLRDKLITRLNESGKSAKEVSRKLDEDIQNKNDKVVKLNEQLTTLQSKLEESENLHHEEKRKLTEQVQELTKDSVIKRQEYAKKINQQTQLTEKYKSIAKTAVDKYIKARAVMLGVDTNEIKNKLPSNYSFNDIDRICEDLKTYRVSVSNLPFDTTTNTARKVKVKVQESIDPISNITNSRNMLDDDPGDYLTELASR